MSKFYDGIVKQVTNDTLKRLGGDKVHTVDSADVGMDKSNKGMKYQDQTNMEFDITPAMRAKVLGEGMPLFSKSRLVRDIDEPAEEPKQLSGVDKNLGKIKDGFNELKEAYLRNPEFTQSKKIIGEYTGALQEIDFNLSKFAKQINDTFPKDKQEAITNYLQAGGDEAILRDRADKSGDKYKQGYQDALNLSPKEKEMANFIRDQQETFWKQANEAGILESHVDNYVRGQWERENAAGEKIIALANSGMLNDKPREAMQKVFANYFEGEQLGFKPTDKSIGYQFVAAQRSIRQAIAARKALTDLMHSKEADGRPTVSVGGGGSMIGEGEAKPYFVKPNIQAKDTEDYKSINHPSLRKWKWVGADIEGKPILMQGNMYIHPDAYDRMNALLGESLVRKFEISKRVPIIGGTRPGDAMLKMGAFIKSTMLVGPFHQFHLGEHAVFHGVNPFNTPEIDFDKRPLLREGVNHGLMLYNHNAMHEFAEGLTSGGLLHMIEKKTGILADKGIPYLSKTPIIGDGLQRYGEYLFQDYIPRVKAMMYEHAVERAMEYYKADIAAGKFSRDQLLDNAAKQANAAFGELNYKYMGRDPTQQDLARIVLLAPDFLEARFKFAGQALRPKGKEQMMALIKAAAIMAGGAQLLNAMFGDEDRGPWYQHPFSTIIGGREYSPRSVVGDISHLITDFRGFWSARLNPLWGKPLLELSTGRDAHGQLETLDDGVKSILKSWVPIPAQGAFKNSQGLTTPERFLMAALSSIGMTNFVSKTAAEKKISDIGFGHMTVMAKTALQQKRYSAFSDLKNDYISGDLNSMDDVRIKAKESGLTLNKMQLSSIRMARDTSPQGKIKVMEARMKNFSAEDVMSVWEEADPDEKKALHSFMLRKVNNSHTMKYADKQAARSELSK